jgi:hypothetical protein
MEGLYCVWRQAESGYYIEQYARQLQAEYSRLAERYVQTRKWSDV